MEREEQLKLARQLLESGVLSEESANAIKADFPELAESEDERIRKLLVWQVHRNIEDETNDLAQSVYDGIKGHDPDLEESIEDWKKCLAYLEKQKEQKPAEWSEKDEKIWKDIFDLCNRFGYDDACRLLKSISRRSWKPSEEQMFALDSAILMFHNLKRGGDKKELESLYNDLKKL